MDEDLKRLFEGIRRELRIIFWLLWVAGFGVGLLVLKAYGCWR